MGFRINTNIGALNAHNNALTNNRNVDSSLSKLSSGLRINTAADDASGLAIADSLRSQSSALGQAISNANDGIGIIQTADKAMDEQLKILDTIKTKATQAAQDGQTADTRKALQADISRLMQSLDNIAGTTSFNGKQLLSGQFTNQSFQVGAYSNQTVGVSIGATSTDKIGHVRFETTATGSILTGASTLTFTGTSAGSNATVTLESVTIGSGAGQGVGALAEVVNKNSELLGVRASWTVQETSSAAVIAATGATAMTINGISFTVNDIKANDSDGKLAAAINSYKDTTGVTASIDPRGNLNLTSTDGRSIATLGMSGVASGVADATFTGRLTLTSLSANDIKVSDGGAAAVATTIQATVNLRSTLNGFTNSDSEAMGAFANANIVGAGSALSAGVTSRQGAMAMMDIAESATKQLDRVRSDLGSAQNQLVSTVNNISVTQVNVKAAESQIRDVDFAAESANFSKFNILSQAGSYAMSQSNAVQQNVLKLLQ